MKRIMGVAISAAALFISGSALAADINVRIINLTNGIFYTPFLVAAHTDDSSLFSTGSATSADRPFDLHQFNQLHRLAAGDSEIIGFYRKRTLRNL